MRRTGAEAGQATVFGIGLVFVVLVVIGLVWDGTSMFVAKARMQTVADTAALAGAAAVSEEWILTGDLARPPMLDQAQAHEGARRSLEISRSQQAPLLVEVDGVHVDDRSVTVSVHTAVAPTFLALAGLDRTVLRAEARAEARQLP